MKQRNQEESFQNENENKKGNENKKVDNDVNVNEEQDNEQTFLQKLKHMIGRFHPWGKRSLYVAAALGLALIFIKSQSSKQRALTGPISGLVILGQVIYIILGQSANEILKNLQKTTIGSWYLNNVVKNFMKVPVGKLNQKYTKKIAIEIVAKHILLLICVAACYYLMKSWRSHNNIQEQGENKESKNQMA